MKQVAKCEGTDKVVTGSTWGDLRVWGVTKTKLAFLGKIMVHQSGVNCLQVCNTKNENDRNKETKSSEMNIAPNINNNL